MTIQRKLDRKLYIFNVHKKGRSYYINSKKEDIYSIHAGLLQTLIKFVEHVYSYTHNELLTWHTYSFSLWAILRKMWHFRVLIFEIRLKSKLLIKERDMPDWSRHAMHLICDAWFYFSVFHWCPNSSAGNVVTYVTDMHVTFHNGTDSHTKKREPLSFKPW